MMEASAADSPRYVYRHITQEVWFVCVSLLIVAQLMFLSLEKGLDSGGVINMHVLFVTATHNDAYMKMKVLKLFKFLRINV